MKITVIMDSKGIVGTARHAEERAGPSGTGGPIAGPKQTAHEIELPSDLEGALPDDLHTALKKHLRKRKKQAPKRA